MHWHPNADEWQYVISGKMRVTMFGAKGRYREEVIEPGWVGYIPQGMGHSIENIGGEEGRILLGLNSGNFQAINLSEGSPQPTNDAQEPTWASAATSCGHASGGRLHQQGT